MWLKISEIIPSLIWVQDVYNDFQIRDMVQVAATSTVLALLPTLFFSSNWTKGWAIHVMDSQDSTASTTNFSPRKQHPVSSQTGNECRSEIRKIKGGNAWLVSNARGGTDCCCLYYNHAIIATGQQGKKIFLEEIEGLLEWPQSIQSARTGTDRPTFDTPIYSGRRKLVVERSDTGDWGQ